MARIYIFLICILTTIVLALMKEVEEHEDYLLLRAAKGRRARIPCGLGRNKLDPDVYVLWFKIGEGFLYRFPNQETKRSLHEALISGKECNSKFDICPHDPSYIIQNVNETNDGRYLCRIHFPNSPSVDFIMYLQVIEPSAKPVVFDNNGKLFNKTAGPYPLGASVNLTCKIESGDGRTTLTWRRHGKKIKTAEAIGSKNLSLTIFLSNLSRDDLNAHYECAAQNTDVSDEVFYDFILKMYLPPISVQIRYDNNNHVEIGQPRVIDCVVVGSVPPASVNWHIADTVVTPNVHKELNNGNFTISSLSIVGSAAHKGKELVCEARNPYIEEIFTDSITLNIGYRPSCAVNLEEQVNIKMDVPQSVTCIVQAKPAPVQMSWEFSSGRSAYTNVMEGDLPDQYYSTLTWQPNDDDLGQLLCRTNNYFGEQRSPCSFLLGPGGPPRIPNCILQIRVDVTFVQCEKGWDLGRPQMVYLEIYQNGFLMDNVSNTAGQFFLPKTGFTQTLNVYAVNSQGRSRVKVMEVPGSVKINETQDAIRQEQDASSRKFWIGVTCATCATILIGAGIMIKKIRRQRRNQQADVEGGIRADGTFHREPDCTRERDERFLGLTNIMVNQMARIQNEYRTSPSVPPMPTCRVDHACPNAARAITQTFYV